MRLALAGGAIGLLAALLTQSLRSLVYGVAPLGAITFIAAPVLLRLTVALAVFQPARRASVIEAARILRQ